MFQIVVNCLLLVATNFIGLTSYFLSDKQQRRAFLETRQSLEVKLLIEEQTAEQVCNRSYARECTIARLPWIGALKLNPASKSLQTVSGSFQAQSIYAMMQPKQTRQLQIMLQMILRANICSGGAP
jgi:hypothetical protein